MSVLDQSPAAHNPVGAGGGQEGAVWGERHCTHGAGGERGADRHALRPRIADALLYRGTVADSSR